MITTRSYWVDWICVFNRQPSPTDLKNHQANLIQYLKKYLDGLSKKAAKGISAVHVSVFNEKLEQWYPAELTWGPPASKLKNTGSILLGAKNKWVNILKWEWDQVSSKPLVFNFKAYFETNGKRYTAETKGSMTPPPPPPPPGSGTA